MDQLSKEQLTRYLRDGLNHLQDPGFLRHSPLAAIFNVPTRFDTPAELQRILISAVEELEPQPDEPADSRQWRMYESLYYRYIERYDQDNVARQLGLSIRQVRREQKSALEALCFKLWEQFDVDTKMNDPLQSRVNHPESTSNLFEEDLSWLVNENSISPADFLQLLLDVLRLVGPLAAKRHVTINNQVVRITKILAVDAVAMRQILINALGIALAKTAYEGRLDLSFAETASEIQIFLKPTPSDLNSYQIENDERSRFDMAQYLSGLFGGKIKSSFAPNGFSIVVTLPGLEQIPVMVVDDNAMTLQLFQRYVTGTRFHLLAVRNPSEVEEMAVQTNPQMIVLDVMMPRVDGWELISRLRSNRHTHQIPIIVCSIMPQEELALSLGAAGFIQKPVTRETFLSGLTRLLEQTD